MEVIAISALALSLIEGVILLMILRELAALRGTSTSRGIDVEGALPEFRVEDSEGRIVTAGDLSKRVVLFVSAECGPCHQLVAQGAHLDGPTVVVLSSKAKVDRTGPFVAKVRALGPEHLIFDDERLFAQLLQAPGTPFAYVIDAQGRVRSKEVPQSVAQLGRLAVRARAS